MLKRTNENENNDTRIADLKKARVVGTRQTHAASIYAGTYHSDIYGKISVEEKDGNLRLLFADSPRLNATLRHWHYDTFEILWDEKHAWFSFGIVKFNMDGKLLVTGMDFEVPNDDIFFEELKPVKIKP
jgi:hypothetical protein